MITARACRALFCFSSITVRESLSICTNSRMKAFLYISLFFWGVRSDVCVGVEKGLIGKCDETVTGIDCMGLKRCSFGFQNSIGLLFSNKTSCLNNCVGVSAMHYGLRLIERGHFRFFRFCMKISVSFSN